MINETRLQEILPYYSVFDKKAEAFKKLLDDNKLSLTIDINTLLFQYKLNLFTDLLKVDKGLKFRYDLLKSDMAKRDLINSSVNLDGYTIVNELKVNITDLNTELERVNNNFRFDKYFAIPTMYVLVNQYTITISKYLQNQLISWNEKQINDLETIQNFRKLFDEIKKIFYKSTSSRELVAEIDGLFVDNNIDELKLWHRLNNIDKAKELDAEIERRRVEKYNSPAEVEKRRLQAITDEERRVRHEAEQAEAQERHRIKMAGYASLELKKG